MITDISLHKLTKILLKRAFSFGGSGFEEGIFGFISISLRKSTIYIQIQLAEYV